MLFNTNYPLHINFMYKQSQIQTSKLFVFDKGFQRNENSLGR